MIIRKATPKDAQFISPLLLLAMQDIVFQIIGMKQENTAREFMLHFIKRENNQYSYQNCFVAEENYNVIAAVNLYDGSKLKELRKPIIEYIHKCFGTNLQIEDESGPGEYYIDSLGVNPSWQGKGVGTKLLQFLINEYVNLNKQTLGLLVDENNPNAKKLYLKLGFSPVGKTLFLGKPYDHLQIKG